MSFTADVKEELARVAPTCSHCEKATLAALVRIEGTLLLRGSGKYGLEIATDIASVARLIVKLLHETYGLKTDFTMRQSVLHKTPNWLIEVPLQPSLEQALHDMGVLGTTGLEMGIDPHLIEKNCCQAAYLRGVFLGSGFVANPRGDFHFEMTVENDSLAAAVCDLMINRGINARIMQRRSSNIIYLKSGEAISDFLVLTGAHQCALAMENERVRKSVRNDVNRKVNAEMANQDKCAKASMEQIMAIRQVIDYYGLEAITPALRNFMRLRVAHPEATLKELGELADPPLSKSAVYHRVRRIEQMAAAIKE